MRDPQSIEALGRRARERVLADFSRDREADEISAVYRRIWAGFPLSPLAQRGQG
jgi:hypothetical protein